VYFDLNETEEEIINGMSSQRRRSILAASKRTDIRFNTDTNTNIINYLCDLYYETMRRNNAEPKYLFPLSFFLQSIESLKNNLSLCYIVCDDKPISASLILRYGGISYDWLAGSNSRFHHLHINEFCVYSSALMAKHNGDKLFILGGGRAGHDDSLFEFKSRFSKKTRDFYIYKKIHLNEEYQYLLKLRNGYHNNPVQDFFPEYRGK
ncbi:MAG: GNAT family N-acetyltransferase, partial [Eubacteriales bacterium]